MFADGEHVWVDVGYSDVDVWVGVVDIGVVDHAESNIAGASGYVEDTLRLAKRCCCPRVERRDKVIP